MCTVAPEPRVASILASGASVGTYTSHGTPRARAPAASACAWLPAEAPTTPAVQPSPSAASLAATPRILNEPVRCRFSALSATTPPARSEIVREDRIGVRRAIVSTAGRAAATSIGRDSAHQSGTARIASISTSRPQRQRGHADRAAGRRIAQEVGAVRLVDVLERARCRSRRCRMRTASASCAPAAAATMARLSRQRRVWSPIEPSTSEPVSGIDRVWPDRKTSPLDFTACE